MTKYTVNNTVNTELSTSNYMEAGIHENVELTKVEYGVSPNNSEKEFIAFYFNDETGTQLSHTEWKPKDGFDTTPKTIANQIARIKQIVCGPLQYNKNNVLINPESITFLHPDKYNIDVDNFKDFATKTISLLGDTFKGKLVRIKAVYSNTGYITLPSYSKFAFIEPMTISLDKSKIRILSMDKITRPIQQAATSNANPFDTSVVPTQPKDEYPF
jgi:hypothetical protein